MKFTHAIRKQAINQPFHASYLGRIVFDERLRGAFKATYLRNIRLVALLIIVIWIAGIYSFMTLPRRLNPQINISIVTITTVLPGAGPTDVEQLVTTPIENAVKGTDNIDTITSSSQQNVSNIVIQFLSSTDQNKAKSDVQAAVDTVTTLPKDAQRPQVITLDFENAPVWQFAVTAPSQDYASLARFSQNLQNRLKDIPSVNKVTVDGLQTREIQVQVSEQAAQAYQLNPQILATAIKTALPSYPAGNVITQTNTFAVTLKKGIGTVADIRNLVITINNQQVLIGDLATVTERNSPDQPTSFYANHTEHPGQSIVFSVFKNKSVNIDKAVKDAQDEANRVIAPYNKQFQIATIMNLGKDISDQFGDLLNNFQNTIILVFLTLLIFLGFRQAMIASFTIPLAFLVAFTVMKITGLTLNFLSMFSLLLALGLLVDDTIVVVTAMTAYYRSGKWTAEETGLLVWRDFIVPIWTTTIATVWAFFPLLLSSGIIGEFIKTIPIVVAATLYASTAIAVLITLPLMIIILEPKIARRVKIFFGVIIFVSLLTLFAILDRGYALYPLPVIIFGLLVLVTYWSRRDLWRTTHGFLDKWIDTQKTGRWLSDIFYHGLIDIPRISAWYEALILRIMQNKAARRKTIVIVILFAVLSYLLVPFGFVPNEFFPKADQDQLIVSLELPQGTNNTIASQKAMQLADRLRTVPNVAFVTASTGGGGNTFGNQSSGNSINETLVLIDKHQRKQSSITIADTLRQQFAHYPDGNVQVVEESGGPPAGADVQISLLGDDLQTLDQYADLIVTYLQRQHGVTNVNKSIKPGISQIAFQPDNAKLAQNGLTYDMVGNALRTFSSGFTVDKLTQGTDQTDIVFRFNDTLQPAASLASIIVPTQMGNSVPILSLGNFTLAPNPSVINHDTEKRTISVSAFVTKGVTTSQVNQGLLQYANSLSIPPGYSWKTGGVNDENNKSIQSILVAMVLSAILILTTMVIQFSSFRKALIVMLVIPFSIAGVFIVFALTGTPLSFPALIGILALFGIVVTISMVVVDKINRNLAIGMPMQEAIADAAASRLEPILLSSLCTIIGLVPISIANPLWRGLGGAIIAGLLFAGVIVLFFIPVVYDMWFGNQQNP